MALTANEYARFEGAFDEVIAVDLGPQKQRIFLSKKLACQESDFIKAATHARWNATGRVAVDLSDEDLAIFGLFARWIYNRSVWVGLLRPTDIRYLRIKAEDVNLLDQILVSAYLLGQKILSSRFQDAVVSTIAKRFRSNITNMSPENVSLAFDGTPQYSSLRRVIVAQFLWLDSQHRGAALDDSYPPELFLELGQTAFSGQHSRVTRPLDPFSGKGICNFHQHKEEEDCSAYCTVCGIYKGCIKKDAETFLKPHSPIQIGPEHRVFYAPDAFACYYSQENARLGMPRPSELSSSAFELLLQMRAMNLRLMDIFGVIFNEGTEEQEMDALLIKLIDLYQVGRCFGLLNLMNDTIEAVLSWTKVAKRLPSKKAIDYTFALLGPAQAISSHENSTNMLKLLAMLSAWSAEISTCTNVDFLQTLALAQTSIRDTVNELGQLQLHFAPNSIVPPWEGKHLCKYFHIHSETTPCHIITELEEHVELAAANYQSRTTPDRGLSCRDRHDIWVATVDWHFQMRMEDLRRNLEAEDDNAEGADESPKKRQRPS
ncbi:hypothetical protein BDV97DRAFT_394848 [Delphinella strobiligena]|nr:hypothetical protein BDV97DRAFT_394848 [Delphinella strobiligena]